MLSSLRAAITHSLSSLAFSRRPFFSSHSCRVPLASLALFYLLRCFAASFGIRSFYLASQSSVGSCHHGSPPDPRFCSALPRVYDSYQVQQKSKRSHTHACRSCLSADTSLRHKRLWVPVRSKPRRASASGRRLAGILLFTSTATGASFLLNHRGRYVSSGVEYYRVTGEF